MRKAYSIFTSSNNDISGKAIPDANGQATVTFDNHQGGKAFILLNPTAEEMTYELSGSWNMICNGSVAGAESLGTVSGEITVPAYSAIVLVNDKLMGK